jgi:hypothetical protein
MQWTLNGIQKITDKRQHGGNSAAKYEADLSHPMMEGYEQGSYILLLP